MSQDGLKFTETHEWARMEDGKVTVGLSKHAIEQLGDIVYLDLPAAGARFEKGSPFGVVESVKAASDIYTPVTGVVTDVNATLGDQLDIFKEDPQGQAWLIRIEPEQASQFDELMDQAAYEQFIQSQAE